MGYVNKERIDAIIEDGTTVPKYVMEEIEYRCTHDCGYCGISDFLGPDADEEDMYCNCCAANHNAWCCSLEPEECIVTENTPTAWREAAKYIKQKLVVDTDSMNLEEWKQSVDENDILREHILSKGGCKNGTR